jgi:hypothetical protein
MIVIDGNYDNYSLIAGEGPSWPVIGRAGEDHQRTIQGFRYLREGPSSGIMANQYHEYHG